MIEMFLYYYISVNEVGVERKHSCIVADAKRSFLYPKETRDNEVVLCIINFAFL